VAGFDVIYACQDFAVDRSLGLHSIPAKFGVAKALNIARLLHALALAALALFGFLTPELGRWFWIGYAFTAALLIIEHALARSRELVRINIAFFQVNAVIGLVVLTAVGLDLFAR
jgi:4-hydroxybenzoate polyprenyltransferase